MFVVIELQENNGVLANLVTSHETLQDAESKYHTILASAAISSIDVHSAVLLNSSGSLIKSEFYRHPKNGGVTENE